MASAGPLGALPGMIYDPIRKKYFRGVADASPPAPVPTPARSSTRTTTQARYGGDGLPQPRKRQKNDRKVEPVCAFTRPYMTGEAGPSRLPTGRSRERKLRSRLIPSDASICAGRVQTQVDYYANMELEHSAQMVETPCERITSMNTYPDGSLFTTTDHGRVIMKRQDQCTSDHPACNSSLLGIHVNMPRNMILTISSGPQPHIHRDRFEVDSYASQDDGIDLNVQDAHAMSSHGDLLTIGGNQKIITIDTSLNIMNQVSARRDLRSDALAVHHAEHHTVYAGLRNSEIVAVDLRTGRRPVDSTIGRSKRRKAIVGVQRLKDSAVPFGLVASGMANELLLFDIRFGKEPLRSLPGHVNTWFSGLGLATTSDDQILFAAGSDCRIRAWNLLDGSRVSPTDTNPALLSETSTNPLTRMFEDRPSAIQITESGLLDVAVARSVHRFSRPTIVTHHPMTAEPVW